MSLTTNIEEINSVQRRVNVQVPSTLVNKAFEDAYRKLQRKAKLNGFRPGKAPLSIIKKLYGGQVNGDVAEDLINKHLFATLREKSINPIASPVVEKVGELDADKEFSFTAVVDVMPEIKVKDYKGLAFTADKYSVNPESVTREIDFLRRRNAKTKSTTEGAAAAAGHLASIGHKVFHEGNLIENMDVE